ncbi:MAG: hypothetical protein E6I14_08080 [Chloroflexi bacterium]|nr:MAG: hypothetical protein E6I14_08080 [Chloroflexota bacterium]
MSAKHLTCARARSGVPGFVGTTRARKRSGSYSTRRRAAENPWPTTTRSTRRCNKARARRLVREGRMTAAGRTALGSALRREPLIVAPDVARALRAEPGAFERFERLPVAYKRIRLGFIEGARGRPEVFATRLQYFVRMTAQGKRYGMVRS